ncbi:Shedu immune nuclease family protein [Nitrospira sp. NS4]|uniref:Shedu immune nuclease family protein n=1 Tax=Nitrospira sp. NS4 TaxID=3414498 RepID=UPI003C2FE29F
MKRLQPHVLDPARCRKEWNEYSALLASKSVLSERRDILPFFKDRQNLSLLICSYFPRIKTPDLFAHEYQIDGDFVADLVVGDSSVQHYLLIEFENGAPDSIFKKRASKATPDWASRFEGAHSQLIDWLWKLEDKRSTGDFLNTFGSRQASFQGLIIVGKDMQLLPQEKARLKWRMNRTMIDSNAIACVSFNELSDDLDHWLKAFYNV